MAENIIKAEDLLTDEGFLAFCLNRGDADITYWEGLKKSSPLQEKEILQAKALLELLVLKEKPVSNQQQARAYDKFKAATIKPKQLELRKKTIPMIVRLSIAAAVIVTIGLAGYFIFNVPKETLQTVYGELKQQKLSDGSTVILNANSRISYARDFEKAGKREIWMEGEVYFEVSKTADRKPFVVHTDELDIEVTGTKFNVHRRGNATKVFLVEGGVMLHTKQSVPVALVPGDFAELSARGMEKKAIGGSAVTAWLDKEFCFIKTPMAEVARSMEEIYNVTITFSDDQISGKMVSGILPNDNLSVLLETLEAAYGFSIVSKDKEIIIGSK